MKISVSSYSFGSYADRSRLGITGIMDKALEMGFEGIELVECPDTEDIEAVKKIRAHSEKIGLPIIAFDVGADFTKNNCTSIDEETERVKRLVDIAAVLGAPMMRHDVSYGNSCGKYGIGFDDVLPAMVKACRAVADYAEKRGVVTMFENHGFFIQDAVRVEKLINSVAHPNFGYLIDLGNFMCADENPNKAVGSLAKYALHAHAKDFHFKSGEFDYPGEGWFPTRSGNYLRGAIIGHGDAGCARSVRMLKSNGYDGYITIEFEGIEDNLTGIRLGLENLKKYIK